MVPTGEAPDGASGDAFSRAIKCVAKDYPGSQYDIEFSRRGEADRAVVHRFRTGQRNINHAKPFSMGQVQVGKNHLCGDFRIRGEQARTAKKPVCRFFRHRPFIAGEIRS